MIRVLLADDQALIRAGFHVLIDAADDLEVVGEAVDGAQAVVWQTAVMPAVWLSPMRLAASLMASGPAQYQTMCAIGK